MNHTALTYNGLTGGSTEHIRRLAQQLLNACDQSPAPIMLGNTVLKKGTKKRTATSKELITSIIEKKFNQKYSR